MRGKYFLRKDKGPNDLGMYCVYLKYTTMGVSVKKSMDIWVKPEDWVNDYLNDRYIKRNSPKGDLNNQKLVNMKKGFDKILSELLSEPNSVITVPGLRSVLNGTYKEKQERDKGKIPFIKFVLDVNEDIYKREKISYSVWKNIQCNMNGFKRYLQEVCNMETNQTDILYCRDLNEEIMKCYIEWRKKKGNTNDTINKALTPIFKSVKKLVSRGWITNYTGEEILDLYLPTGIVPLGTTDIGEKEHLTEPQVKKLIEVGSQSKYKRTREFLDMYLFAINSSGVRFSDVLTLQWSEVDMDNRIIRHLQYKNHTQKPTIIEIHLSDGGLNILKKWEGRYDRFVFGLLPSDFDLSNEVLLDKIKNTKTKTIDQSLHKLGEKVGLPFTLHFHTSRHTFATLALNKDVPLNVVSHLMYHSSTYVTQKVYSKYLPETISGIVKEKLNFNYCS